MILIRRAATDTPDEVSLTGPAVNVPRQASSGRPETLNVGDIARKSRAVATALQNLYDI
jgi:hypothetical protein